ncbi:hypothetical protein SALB_07547 [Streptomyces noursei]|uniref:Uncharacterized protein n=1 Tax=Streptomyces noursei TaxID=1971 RepID=A0A401RAT2_STRNR|nr:hypothetical protein SALB_07547 [Streptomyces noursei]
MTAHALTAPTRSGLGDPAPYGTYGTAAGERMQEEELSVIERLWVDYCLPDLEGPYFPDG